MSGGTHLWRSVGVVSLLAGAGLALPALPSEPAGLRLLALAGAALVVAGLVLLSRVLRNWDRAQL